MSTTKFPRFADRDAQAPEGATFVRGAVYVHACTYCTARLREGQSFFPPHSPSGACQSGSLEHCTCDVCF